MIDRSLKSSPPAPPQAPPQALIKFTLSYVIMTTFIAQLASTAIALAQVNPAIGSGQMAPRDVFNEEGTEETGGVERAIDGSTALAALAARVASQHPAARAQRFEVEASRYGLKASQESFAPQLTGSFELSDDLATLPNPLMGGARTPYETRRYLAELRLIKPLEWGTQLSVGVRQGLVETTNPWRNCIPGVVSEQCYDSSLNLSLTQPLLRGRSARANRALEYGARAQLSSSEARLRSEVTQLVERIARAYLQVSLARAQLTLEERDLKLTERQLAEGEARLKAGVISPSDLSPLLGAVAQRQQSLSVARARLEEASLVLRELTGEPIPSVHFPRALFDLERARALLALKSPPFERDHPDVLALDHTIAQLKARQPALRDQERPQLDLSIVWSQSGLGEALSDSLSALPNNDSRFYGLTLSYAQALSPRAQLERAQLEAQLQARRADREALLRQLNGLWSRAQAGVTHGERSLKWARVSARVAAESARSANLKWRSGRGTQFEALELQTRALSAQTQALITRHQVAEHVLTMLSLSGELLARFGIIVTPAPINSPLSPLPIPSTPSTPAAPR